jgi:hypothetical protein
VPPSEKGGGTAISGVLLLRLVEPGVDGEDRGLEGGEVVDGSVEDNLSGDLVIVVTQDVADAHDLLPGDLWVLFPKMDGQAATRLRDDLDRPFDDVLKSPVARLGLERQVLGLFLDAIDRSQDRPHSRACQSGQV